MKLKLSAFTIFTLAIASVYLIAYAIFVNHFKNDSIFEAKLNILKDQMNKEIEEKEFITFQLKDLKSNVASLLPEKSIQANENLALKNLAHSTRLPASINGVELSSKLYSKGKRYFASGKIDKAIQEFKKIDEMFPLSNYRIESEFLLSESYFLTKQYQLSLSTIENMVVNYPEHELTGYALLRMGQIAELNLNFIEARDIYNSVKEYFKNPLLKKQANDLLLALKDK